MARNKEYKREEVVDAATRVFWVKGFKGTAVSDLVAATGLNKHSMYQEFGSKEGLFRECIDNYVLRLNSEGRRLLGRQPLCIENIEAFFRRMSDHAASSDCPGCLLVNSAIEKELLEEEAFLQVKNSLSRVEELFCQNLVAAQANGEITQEKDCRTLAAFLFTFANGLMVQGKTGRDKETLESMVAVALSILKK
ncbi:TetR family transcriptional regulator [Desulfuromonas versatilis]|uniref:TetR family transcriptional regulator n=1 Tax=Desulfuromonas versatilis TaxID=2802975 RepID=A0ABN6E398_9BACT|nr:TetR/AcrR family transcriptional regulator [Desulfuromonas versatilis]BCR06279.1 TetR family transcriptional regulator [Desulfuromonas versatilis]